MTHLILNASLPVQAIMLLLLLASIISWGLILQKITTFKRLNKAMHHFDRWFWQGRDLQTLYNQLHDDQALGSAAIFKAGFEEFLKSRARQSNGTSMIMDNTGRAMKVAAMQEIETLETHQGILATLGSVSPYIGLLGTVWGIMHAFIGLSSQSAATLAAVAPGIAEALIATAMGLFVAIPSVISFNLFSSQTDRMYQRFDIFIDEVTNIFQRTL